MRPMKRFTQTDLNETEGLYDSHQDRWSRRAKRHFSRAELLSLESNDRLFEQNETVIYRNSEVKVKIPEGPRQSVGILFEGKLRMVTKSDLTKLDEMVMGMTALQPISRMMELAGVGTREPVVESDDDCCESIKDKLYDAMGNRMADSTSQVTLNLTMAEAKYLQYILE